MKKLFTCAVALIVAVIAVFSVAGCDAGAKAYTVEYTDDNGAHKITVQKGATYSIEELPERFGYEFSGLFDAEIGGTQYVSASGTSLSPFSGNKNLMLYPQYKAKNYTVILDYQGAQATGESQFSAVYGEKLPELPKNVALAHKVFNGWFTEKNCGGKKVADEYGLISSMAVLNAENFEFRDDRIFLYAGFEVEKFKVTCHFEAGYPNEVLSIAYDTPASKIVPKTRVDGNAPISWSLTPNGEPWNGKIYENVDLYACEYAPVLEFDVKGGEPVAPIVARSGATITLPTPEKNLAQFVRWQDEYGNTYSSTEMPLKSMKLTAVWQAKIVLDENGGSSVQSISLPAGQAITLPESTRDGYFFAGWFTADKVKFTATAMPAEGVSLKAGWYTKKTAQKVVVSATKTVKCTYYKDTFADELTLNFSEFLPADFDGTVSLNVIWKQKHTDATVKFPKNVSVGFYFQRTVSDAYLWARATTSHDNVNKVEVERTYTKQLNGNKIYVTLACDSSGTGWTYGGSVTDFRYVLTYPDISDLII